MAFWSVAVLSVSILYRRFTFTSNIVSAADAAAKLEAATSSREEAETARAAADTARDEATAAAEAASEAAAAAKAAREKADQQVSVLPR